MAIISFPFAFSIINSVRASTLRYDIYTQRWLHSTGYKRMLSWQMWAWRLASSAKVTMRAKAPQA